MAKIALLIGVSEYETGLDGLPSAVNDVTAMKQVLANPEMGDFVDASVTVLQNPSRQAMEDAIYHLFANRQKDDLVLLYFSGHGVVDDGGEFYFASRFTRKEQGRLVPTTAVAARSVRDWMEQSRSQHKVIILDSCFSGAFAKGVTAKDSGSVNPEQFLGGKGTAILTASTSTQYALAQEGFDLSVYTHYLVEGIRTGGADRDNDGFISAEELHDYANSKVKEAAPAMTPEFYPVKEGYKILLAKSPKDDPKLKYRKEVQARAEQGQGKFSIFAQRLLEVKRREWGISAKDAEAIKAEVLQPYSEYERKLHEYEQAFAEAAQVEYPFGAIEEADLRDYEQHLGLRDSDIAAIKVRVLEPILKLSRIRFDGLYQAAESGVTSYLRFYRDSIVLSVSSTGNPVQVTQWFNKSNSKVSKGSYSLDDSRLTFSTTSSHGTVDYKGVIEGEKMILDTHSYVNGHRSKKTYSFVKVP